MIFPKNPSDGQSSPSQSAAWSKYRIPGSGCLSKLNAVGEFDLVTAFDVIHDQANPAQVLKKSMPPCGWGGHS